MKKFGWAPDASGVVKETSQEVAPKTNVSTTHNLSNALVRRGLALEMAGMLTFAVHERLRRTLLEALTEDPPPGYAPASMAQLERADRFLFDWLSEDTREGVRGIAASGLPLDRFLERHLDTNKFNMLLCPLARIGSSGASSSSQAPANDRNPRPNNKDKQERQIEHLKNQVENLKRKQQGEQRQQRAKKPATKSKTSGPMPRELRGHLSSTSKGNICFSANTQAGCQDAALGGVCRKGWHICCHRICKNREGHLFPQCPH